MRAGNDTGNENAPVPAFASPLPSITEPCQSTSTCRSNVAMRSPSDCRLLVVDSRMRLAIADWRFRITESTFASRDSQLHAEPDQPEHDPRNRHPALSRRRRHRIQDPDVARRRGTRGAAVAGKRELAHQRRPGTAEGRGDDDDVALQ